MSFASTTGPLPARIRRLNASSCYDLFVSLTVEGSTCPRLRKCIISIRIFYELVQASFYQFTIKIKRLESLCVVPENLKENCLDLMDFYYLRRLFHQKSRK